VTERQLLEQILEELRDQCGLLHRILHRLPVRAESMTYEISATPFTIGECMGQPVTLNVGQVGFGKVTEWSGPNGTGTVVAPLGPKGIIFASDNTAIATVDAKGNPTGVSAGVAHISALDQDNNLTDTAVCTVVAVTPPPPTAVSMTLDLSATPFA